MSTQRAFIAGGNNTVLLLRGQPQFCGQRGYIREMLLLYMFITLPWKNKRLGHRHFLSSSLPSHLSKPVWEGGRQWEFRWGLSTCHTSSFSEIDILISLFAYILSRTPLFHRPALVSPLNPTICYIHCLNPCGTDLCDRLVYVKCWFSVTLETREGEYLVRLLFGLTRLLLTTGFLYSWPPRNLFRSRTVFELLWVSSIVNI